MEMATPPPPLIRSSKAFSVEIPEGSNSAKARRSDIVANDELDIRPKSPQFHESAADLQAQTGTFGSDTFPNDLAHSETSTDALDAFVHAEDAKVPEERLVQDSASVNLAPRLAIEDKPDTQNIAQLPAQDPHTAGNMQALADDRISDRFAFEETGQAFKDKHVGEANTPLQDRLAGEAGQALTSNVQAVAQEAFRDRLQQLPQDSPHSTDQAGITRDAINDSSQAGLDTDPLTDRFGHETNQGVQDRFGAEGNPAIQDKQLGEAEALTDKRQTLDDDALQQQSAKLPTESPSSESATFIDGQQLTDNRAAIADEAMHGRQDELENSPIKDHIEPLPDTHQVLKPGPSPLKKGPEAHAGVTPTPAAADHHHSTTAPSGHAAPSELSKAEHAKRMEEFHGRVEAIRKSVSGINHLLDDLQDKH